MARRRAESQNVFGIDDQWATEEGFDFAEVESAKLRPAGPDDECFHAFSHGVRRLAIVHGAVQFEFGMAIATGSKARTRAPRETRLCASLIEAEPATELVLGLKAKPRIPTSLFCKDCRQEEIFSAIPSAREWFTSLAALGNSRVGHYFLAPV